MRIGPSGARSDASTEYLYADGGDKNCGCVKKSVAHPAPPRRGPATYRRTALSTPSRGGYTCMHPRAVFLRSARSYVLGQDLQQHCRPGRHCVEGRRSVGAAADGRGRVEADGRRLRHAQCRPGRRADPRDRARRRFHDPGADRNVCPDGYECRRRRAGQKRDLDAAARNVLRPLGQLGRKPEGASSTMVTRRPTSTITPRAAPTRRGPRPVQTQAGGAMANGQPLSVTGPSRPPRPRGERRSGPRPGHGQRDSVGDAAQKRVQARSIRMQAEDGTYVQVVDQDGLENTEAQTVEFTQPAAEALESARARDARQPAGRERASPPDAQRRFLQQSPRTGGRS